MRRLSRVVGGDGRHRDDRSRCPETLGRDTKDALAGEIARITRDARAMDVERRRRAPTVRCDARCDAWGRASRRNLWESQFCSVTPTNDAGERASEQDAGERMG